MHWKPTLAAVLLLVLLTAAVRLPGVQRPLLGNFATKNVAYAMIARNWASGEAWPWFPTLDLLADGRPAWHLLEVPLSAYLAGGMWRLCGGSLDLWGRAVSIALSAASTAMLFVLVKRWHGTAAAWGASCAWALSPVSIIYGQSFMLEASVAFLTLGVIGSWCRWLERGRGAWLVIFGLAFAALLLTKVYMIVLLLPLGALWWRGRQTAAGETPAADFAAGGPQRKPIRGLAMGVALLLAILPAAAWVALVWQVSDPKHSSSARVYYSLRESADRHDWPHPIVRSAKFYRQALDNLSGVVLTPLGIALALAGLANPAWRRHGAWLGAMGLLIAALPLKFHEMNYYYVVILPPLCILIGLGWQLVSQRLRPGKLATACMLVVAAGFAARYSARPAFVTPEEDQAVLEAAAAVRALTRPEAPVVTVHGSTIDLLYYCRRRGWALSSKATSFAGDLAACQASGARSLVVCGIDKLPHQAQAALEGHVIVRRGPDWAVFALGPVEVAEYRSALPGRAKP
jgi:4-amino-4-deoxy-L-arabinose transferase-like glycosyltransferase